MCQPDQDPSGPPWMIVSSGAGVCGDASGGSISQARSGVPSAATVRTSATRPGTSAGWPGVGSGAGSWSAAAVSRTTASGGVATVDRSAYSRRPSGAGHRSEKQPAALSRVTRAFASGDSGAVVRSTRKAGVRPSWSATKNSAAPSGAHTGCSGHNSKPGSRSRPSPLARSTSHKVTSGGSSGVPCQKRWHTTRRPSGEQATASTDDAGSSNSTRRSPLAVLIATSWVRGLRTSSCGAQVVTTVAPSGVSEKLASSSARPGPAGGASGAPCSRRPWSAAGGAAQNSRGSRGPSQWSQKRMG